MSGERETVWNSSAYLEYLHGRDEIRVTQWGLVKIAGRRRSVVVGFLDTILNDISRGIDEAFETEEFRKRLQVDCLVANPVAKDHFERKDKDFLTKDWKGMFIQSIKDESAARV